MESVSLPEREELSSESQKIYDEKMEKYGMVSHMTLTLLRSAEAFRAMEFYPIRDVMTKIVGTRAVYFYCYAISKQDDCLVCSTYHGRLLKQMNLKPEEFQFTDIETLLISYGKNLVRDPNHISRELMDQMKKYFSEDEIVVITTVGCKMIASNIFNNALKIKLDAYLNYIDPQENIIEDLKKGSL